MMCFFSYSFFFLLLKEEKIYIIVYLEGGGKNKYMKNYNNFLLTAGPNSSLIE
jgi:hypothetical protein